MRVGESKGKRLLLSAYTSKVVGEGIEARDYEKLREIKEIGTDTTSHM